MTYYLSKVISGGQTGADQGGLIAAHKIGLLTGGTAPSNWYTETGPNALLELLGLSAAGNYRTRTIKNVHDSDGTLLLTVTPDSPGSKLTRNEAIRQHKPFLQCDMTEIVAAMDPAHQMRLGALLLEPTQRIMDWLIEHQIATLNVAGNREKHRDLRSTRSVELVLTQVFEALDLEDMILRDRDL